MKFKEIFTEQQVITKAKDAKGNPMVDVTNKKEMEEVLKDLEAMTADNLPSSQMKDLKADIKALKNAIKAL